MAATDAGVEVGARSKPASRITGLDLARAVAMAGMVVVHYIFPDGDRNVIEWLALAWEGRAMPLFILLGGVGVTIMTARSKTPDRDLLVRAAILLPIGFITQELTTWIAIILQLYSLLFLLAIGLRRLSNAWLLGLAGAMTAIGAWTYQVVGPGLPGQDLVLSIRYDPIALFWSLLINGYYPLFPVGAFFLLGMWIGRLDLRSRRVSSMLAIGGVVIGFGTAAASVWLANALSVGEEVFEPAASAPVVFSFERLLDIKGHSSMPGWMISASGTAIAIVGLSLLIAPRLPRLVRPFIAVGQLALTFYVFQASMVRFTPDPQTLDHVEELSIAVALYAGFTVFAVLWKGRFRSGPLESLLRIGSRHNGRQAAPAQVSGLPVPDGPPSPGRAPGPEPTVPPHPPRPEPGDRPPAVRP